MCRGCQIELIDKSKGQAESYLNWLADYENALARLRYLNTQILAYENNVANGNQRKVVSRFRRRLIKLRKEMAQANGILNNIYDTTERGK